MKEFRANLSRSTVCQDSSLNYSVLQESLHTPKVFTEFFKNDLKRKIFLFYLQLYVISITHWEVSKLKNKIKYAKYLLHKL